MLSDEALMAAIQAGDEAAFETLVTRHYPFALKYAAAFIADPKLCEEVVTDCFAALYFKCHRFDVTLSFTKYLKALLRHKCIDALRSMSRLPVPMDTLPCTADNAHSPESVLVEKVFYESLLYQVEALPPYERALLLAYAFDGKSYKALAHDFHKTVPQIKITLHRIRKRLKSVKEDFI